MRRDWLYLILCVLLLAGGAVAPFLLPAKVAVGCLVASGLCGIGGLILFRVRDELLPASAVDDRLIRARLCTEGNL